MATYPEILAVVKHAARNRVKSVSDSSRTAGLLTSKHITNSHARTGWAKRESAHVEDGDDVRVVETGDGAGFGQMGVGGLGDELGVGNLDGDEPLQLVVVGEVDEAEAALTQHILDSVATDLLGKWVCGVIDCGGVRVTRLVRTCFVVVVHEQGPSAE